MDLRIEVAEKENSG